MNTRNADILGTLRALSPQTQRKIAAALQQHMTPEEHLEAPMRVMQEQPQARSRPRLRYLSGPALSVPLPQHVAPDLQAAVPAAPRPRVTSVALSIVRERRRQARVLFFFLGLFFSLCLFLLLSGIVQIFFRNASDGALLTALGSVASAIGGILIRSVQQNNKNLNEVIDILQKADHERVL